MRTQARHPSRGLLATAACTLLLTGTLARAGGDYLLATASTGGTYYPVGVALSTLVKVKLQPTDGINLSAINSAGSAENIKLMRDDECQFAILQGLYGAYAWNGSGPLAEEGPQKELRAVTMLWQNVEHFLARKDYVKTGTVADIDGMQGRGASFGKRNSGSIGSSRALLAAQGIELDSFFDVFYGGYGAATDALQDGKVDLTNTPAGVPVGAVTKAFAAIGDDIALLNFTPEEAEQADAGLGLWTAYLIPAGTYPGQESDVNTIAQPNFLAVRADVSEEDVYLITKTIYENLGFLQAIHKATDAMALDKAITGLPMPLHPGAARYFKEAGLSLPAQLLADQATNPAEPRVSANAGD
jgi:TRAP transporter TAXI family solute receptor